MALAARAYYTGPGRTLGRAGDFYTSVHVHPLFGAILAAQLREMWALLDRPAPFTVVECGAGAGLLADDILTEAARWPDFHAALHYVLVDIRTPSPRGGAPRYAAGGYARPGRGFHALSDVAPCPIVGCVLSNEFVDALPVHRLRCVAGQWREVWITLDGGELVEVLGEFSTPDLAAYLTGLGVPPVDRQEVEVNLAALRWLEDAAALLARGFLLTIDYGYEVNDLRAGRFSQGSLMAYRQHTAHTDPYQAVGEQDLTTHVNWTVLMQHGDKLGLHTLGLITQSRFLLALGILERAAAWSDDEAQAGRARRAAWQLAAPGGLGDTFQVLVQATGGLPTALRGLADPFSTFEPSRP